MREKEIRKVKVGTILYNERTKESFLVLDKVQINVDIFRYAVRLVNIRLNEIPFSLYLDRDLFKYSRQLTECEMNKYRILGVEFGKEWDWKDYL